MNQKFNEEIAEIRNASLNISAILARMRNGKLTEVSALFEINNQNIRIQRALAKILDGNKI